MYGYRRGSIFWALTLIAVGVLFLYQNFNPAVHPWVIIAKFWPALIIFWGLSKLVDYLRAQAHPESAPAPLFTASEVVLLVLILLFGSLVSKIVLHPWRQWGNMGVDMSDLFLNSYSYSQTLSTPAKPPLHLVVDNRWGDVEVHVSDQPQISAVVKETVRADDEAAAKKIAQQIRLSLGQQAGVYTFQSNLDTLPSGGQHVRLDLVFHVPAQTAAQITTDRGDILLDGLNGEQSLTDRHGDVHVANLQGLLRIQKTGGSTEARDVRGSVELDGRGGDVQFSAITGTATINGDFSGAMEFSNVAQTLRFTSSRTDLSAQKVNGHLRMDLGSLDADGIGGPFEITTRQKDIRISNFAYGLRITDTNGDVVLRPAPPLKYPIEVDLSKGDIELDMPRASNFQIDASARRGDIHSDFSGPDLKLTRQGDTPSLTGSFGKGGPTVRLTTSYGTIHLAQGEASPPGPPALPSGKTAETRLLLHRHRADARVLGLVCPPPLNLRLAQFLTPLFHEIASFTARETRLASEFSRCPGQAFAPGFP